jgi:hypothetical protein
MALAQYTVGTTIQITATFTDDDGVKVDPTEVTAELRTPAGVLEDLTVVRDSTGEYHADYTPALNGLHQYRFIGTGAVAAANEGSFMAQTTFQDCPE